MQTYLFYDTETTGLNKSFDQVLQFAAIRTDLNLKEINRYELKIKLNPDVVPSPYAILTHKIGIQESKNGINEFDAIRQIHQWMNEPGTISLGYNTLGFDDEFLRFSFYRNLLKPYTHQYANQCSRMDIYPMTVMFFLFKNQVIKWPQIDGRVSLKLEQLNHQNAFFSGRAHDAMVDVEITLALAKTLMQERETWEYLHSYFNKQKELDRIQQLQKEMVLLISGKMGAQNDFQCPAMFLGQHRHYKNQSLWLRLDSENLMETSVDAIPETTYVINKKPGEPNFILPLKERFSQRIDSDRLNRSEKNKIWLQQHPDMLKKITDYYADYTYPVYPNMDVQAGIYQNGFWTFEQESLCQRFHAANPKEKAKLIGFITHPVLRTLALRILGRHYPETLSAELSDEFNEYLAEQNNQVDYKGNKRLNQAMAMAEAAELSKKEGLSPEDLALLAEYQRSKM